MLLYRYQNHLESFCMEGLRLNKTEGLQLTSALFNSRRSLKSLYCWNSFKISDVHHLNDSENCQCSLSNNNKINRQSNWLKTLEMLEALTTLSVNYSYIAMSSGNILLALSKKLGVKWQWLQLLCHKDEIWITKLDKTIGDCIIPDTAWEETKKYASSLKVQLIFVQIPEYEKQRKFLTRNIPIHTFSLSTGINSQPTQPWMIDCTIKLVWFWYPNTLVYLYLQIWHDRELLDNLLKKLFVRLPHLQVFEFVGKMENLQTLSAMCDQIRMKQCVVNNVSLQLRQNVEKDEDEDEWRKSVRCLLRCFNDDFNKMNVQFHISHYPFKTAKKAKKIT